MKKVYCPNCYSEFENQTDICSCGYPFNGNDMDKYKFMSQRIKKVKTVKEGIESADYARFVLFIIGGINLLVSIIFLMSAQYTTIHIVTIIYSISLIGLGFLSFKEPFFSLLLGFIVLIIIYIVTGLLDPKLLMSGLIMKVIIISGFVYGLAKIKMAENVIKREQKK